MTDKIAGKTNRENLTDLLEEVTSATPSVVDARSHIVYRRSKGHAGGTRPALSIGSPTQSPGFPLPSSLQRIPLPYLPGQPFVIFTLQKGPEVALCV